MSLRFEYFNNFGLLFLIAQMDTCFLFKLNLLVGEIDITLAISVTESTN